jgi:NADPH-dependent 7-cyano-7-deazaguanine reductase QueF-like protein
VAAAPISEGDILPGALNTETTAGQATAAGAYRAQFDLSLLQSGDAVRIRAKIQIRRTATGTVFNAVQPFYDQTFTNAQAVPVVTIPTEALTGQQIIFTITQTTGTLRKVGFMLLQIA